MWFSKAKCWVLDLGYSDSAGWLDWMILKVSSSLYDSMFLLFSPRRINFTLA